MTIENSSGTAKVKAAHWYTRWVEMRLERDSVNYAKMEPNGREQFDRELSKLERRFHHHRSPFWTEWARLDAGLLFVAKRQGMITPEEWKVAQDHGTSTTGFMRLIDTLFGRVCGCALVRHNDDLRALAVRWLWAKIDNPSKPVEPLKVKPAVTEQPAPAARHVPDKGGDDRKLDSESHVLLMLYTLTPDSRKMMRRVWEKKGWHDLLELVGHAVQEDEPVPVNPEQVDHEDQDAIDDVARGLLADIDL